MKAVIESFGCVSVKVSTPYTRLARYYSAQEWDILGIYYPLDGGYELILYDVYSSARIRGVSSLGELLLWEHVSEISTRKFYSEISEEEVHELVASMLIKDFASSEEHLEELVCHSQSTPAVVLFFEKCIANFQVRQSAQSIYQRTTMGITCAILEQTYEDFYDQFFNVLKRLNKEGCDIFRRQPLVQEYPKQHSIVNRLYTHLLTYKDGLPETLHIKQEELDLGHQPFHCLVPISYSNHHERKLELKSNNFSLILPHCAADLSFLDKKALTELLKYIDFAEDAAFAALESEIIIELSKRDSCL